MTRTSIQTFGGQWLLHLLLGLLGALPILAMASDRAGWHLGDVKKDLVAPAAIGTYQTAPGPHQIVVAVIDSGVITSHPSLDGVVLDGYDMVSSSLNTRQHRSANFAPDEREAKCGGRLVSSSFRTHGTEVSSLIAANGKGGMQGVNPKAKILPIRVFGVCGMNVSDLIDAMYWAAGFKVGNLPVNPNPARIINISISGTNLDCSPPLQQAIDRLSDKNIFIVAAGGNNFNKPLGEPANCRGVISVGSISADNRVERHSALDSRTTIYAPGGGAKLKQETSWAINKIRVASFDPNPGGGENPVVKETAVGTSYASPIVAGYISLWLSYHPEKTPRDWFAEIKNVQRPAPMVEACPQCSPASLVADLKSLR